MIIYCSLWDMQIMHGAYSLQVPGQRKGLRRKPESVPSNHYCNRALHPVQVYAWCKFCTFYSERSANQMVN